MEKAKKDMIDKIVSSISNLGEQTRSDQQLSLDDKVLQVDVLLDIIKFLNNYDENIKVLNDYYYNKKEWER